MSSKEVILDEAITLKGHGNYSTDGITPLLIGCHVERIEMKCLEGI